MFPLYPSNKFFQWHLKVPVALLRPTPLLLLMILIIVELILALNMHEIFATGRLVSNNQSINLYN